MYMYGFVNPLGTAVDFMKSLQGSGRNIYVRLRLPRNEFGLFTVNFLIHTLFTEISRFWTKYSIFEVWSQIEYIISVPNKDKLFLKLHYVFLLGETCNWSSLCRPFKLTFFVSYIHFVPFVINIDQKIMESVCTNL